MASLLDVSDLRRDYGSFTAVDGISFSVQAGEVFGLLGPNGAGKSTTMMMICGLLPTTAGRVTVNGHCLQNTPTAVKQLMGVVPQDLAIYPDLTAEENLSFFGSLYDLTGHVLSERVSDALEQVGLLARRRDPASTFSGGMKRRLNFAAAILHRPKLLILDEPTVGVDPQSRSHLLDCVRKLQQQGTSVIYASHYMEEVEAICSRVAILDHGRILARGTLAELMSRVPQEIELVVPATTNPGQLQLPAEAATSVTDRGLTIRLQPDASSATPELSLNHELSQVLSLLTEQQIPLIHIRTHESNLERLFLELTGTQLRD